MKLHIRAMLKGQRGRHLSFHTPGHKRRGEDITELSYSDNLLSPTGCIARAQQDAARILGAARSFFLTDGSTSGVFSMLYALKARGARRLVASPFSHRSVKNACMVLGLEFVPLKGARAEGIPLQPTLKELAARIGEGDALLLTSPDYYGNFPPLKGARALCDGAHIPLVIDGAHGAHLHFSAEYAGRFADMWVDGVHKSLPARTQGAVVSAHAEYAEALEEGVSLFRTTSPSYPILASVEYAVKYPRNLKTELLAQTLKREVGALANADWSKLVLPFGDRADAAQRALEARGIYPEFNDGNYLMFYLSPCTKAGELKALARALKKLPRGKLHFAAGAREAGGEATELVPLSACEGRLCAKECGVFPPCLPLVERGERVSAAAQRTLLSARSTFGLEEGKMRVFLEEP